LIYITTDVHSPHGPILGALGVLDPEEMKAKAKKYCEEQIAAFQAHLDTFAEWTVREGEDFDDE
jgi:hypothetical protein